MENDKPKFYNTYDEYCPTVYLNYRTEGKQNVGRRITITIPEKTIGGQTFNNVMQLEVVSSYAHYAFYATKDEGIVAIEDLDNEEVWVLESI